MKGVWQTGRQHQKGIAARKLDLAAPGKGRTVENPPQRGWVCKSDWRMSGMCSWCKPGSRDGVWSNPTSKLRVSTWVKASTLRVQQEVGKGACLCSLQEKCLQWPCGFPSARVDHFVRYGGSQSHAATLLYGGRCLPCSPHPHPRVGWFLCTIHGEGDTLLYFSSTTECGEDRHFGS